MDFRTKTISNTKKKSKVYFVEVKFNKDFVEIKNELIQIGVKSKPVNNQANKEVINKLAKHFGISSSKIRIKSGHRTKKKTIEILS